MKIYRCEKCGNIVVKTVNGGGPLSCCGASMIELEAGITDAAQEKHVPAISVSGNVLTARIGEIPHPMTPEHYIQMVLLRQGSQVQYVSFTPSDEPQASFAIDPTKPAEIYEYCNLHGLWMASYVGASNAK